MEERRIIREIVKECTEIEGFLVQLHSLNTFDSNRYNELMNNLARYRDIIQDRDQVNRQVAGCLLALQQELDNKITFYTERESADEKKRIDVAYEDLWQLINDILKV